MPSRPWACRSPKNDSFHPVNGKKDIGAATPMFTPIIPACASWRNLRIAPPEVVKIEAALPFVEAFMISSA